VSLKTKEEAVTVASAVVQRAQEMDAIVKKIVDDDALGLEDANQVQLEKLAADNALAAIELSAWVLEGILKEARDREKAVADHALSVDTLRMPKYAKDDIERVTCRRCGASKAAACFGPQHAAVVAAVAFEGQDHRTEFCYERVHDYFESMRGGRGR
jgi:hypothetical protein